ncbi:MAG: 23S rRNA (uridine(2552)-2'-O)-methyltransferase RlmE [Gammaproteobacteria bacterium]
MPKHTKSSTRWLAEHFSDAYVKRAQLEGWRSRAVFKLAEIQRRDKLIKPGMTVVDLGAAPGGWSQYAAKILAGRGSVLALDILLMEPLDGVKIIQGDFTEEAALRDLEMHLAGRSVDLVLSDIAPNISGEEAIDQPRSMYLAELALAFALPALAPKGVFLVKTFQGTGFSEYLQAVRRGFQSVVTRKPSASRVRSRELYVLAKHPRV